MFDLKSNVFLYGLLNINATKSMFYIVEAYRYISAIMQVSKVSCFLWIKSIYVLALTSLSASVYEDKKLQNKFNIYLSQIINNIELYLIPPKSDMMLKHPIKQYNIKQILEC